jgi:hypothetical protein
LEANQALVSGGYDTSLTINSATSLSEKVREPAHIKVLVERSSRRAFLFGKKRQEEVAK